MNMQFRGLSGVSGLQVSNSGSQARKQVFIPAEPSPQPLVLHLLPSSPLPLPHPQQCFMSIFLLFMLACKEMASLCVVQAVLESHSVGQAGLELTDSQHRDCRSSPLLPACRGLFVFVLSFRFALCRNVSHEHIFVKHILYIEHIPSPSHFLHLLSPSLSPRRFHFYILVMYTFAIFM